jgi:uncharacterized protein YbjQ (UPF0145 family)
LIISTTNDLPGYRIDEVMGEVFGAVIAFRFDTSELGTTCAYRTAVRASRP